MVLGFSILFTMFSVIIFSNNLAAAGGGFGDESGDPVDQDEPLPDLAITGIVLGNANGDEMIVKGDRGIIHVYVTNLGEDLVGDRFDILVEYWYHANEYREEWYFLKVVSEERTFGVQRIESSTIVWETGINDYKPGTYTFRARLLLDPSTPDGNETNNVFPVNFSDYEETTVTLQEPDFRGTPEIRIINITATLQYARVNELVFINVTIRNSGDADARYVDIYYYINHEFMYFQTIERLGAGNDTATMNFMFWPDARGSYDIHFEVRDDGRMVHYSEAITIYCPCYCPPPPPQPREPEPGQTTPITETGTIEPEPFPTMEFAFSLYLTLIPLWGTFIVLDRHSSLRYWTKHDIALEIRRFKARIDDYQIPHSDAILFQYNEMMLESHESVSGGHHNGDTALLEQHGDDPDPLIPNEDEDD